MENPLEFGKFYSNFSDDKVKDLFSYFGNEILESKEKEVFVNILYDKNEKMYSIFIHTKG